MVVSRRTRGFLVVGLANLHRTAKRRPLPHAYEHGSVANLLGNSNYPWSLYAVFQTTITQWAFPLDVALIALFYLALSEAGYYAVADEGQVGNVSQERSLLWALFLGHMLFSKTIKLVPHLLRNPGDVRFVPVSILFGYFHNLIKLYGFMTVTEVRGCIMEKLATGC